MLTQDSDATNETDLLTDVGNEIKVTLDRWTVGQLGVTDLLIAAAVILGGLAIAWLASRVSRSMSRRSTGAVRAAIATSGLLIGSGVVTLAGAIALEVLGFGLGPVLVLVVLLVIALVLLRPVVTNLGSGVLLQVRGALEEGDLISTRDALGTVREINARSVVLDTSDGRRVHIPNSEVLNDSIENYTAQDRRRSSFELLIDTEPGLTDALYEITSAVDSCPEVLPEPAPTVEVTGFVGRYANVRVRIWHGWPLAVGNNAVHQAAIRVVDKLSAAGVELPGPELVGMPASPRQSDPT